MKVRRCNIGDLQAMNRLLEELYIYHVKVLKADLDGYTYSEYDEMAYNCLLKSKEHIDFVGVEGDDVVGYIHYRLYDGYRAHINEVVIDKAKRNKGYGRELIMSTISLLPPKFTRITLVVHHKNKKGYRFYKSIGFKEIVSSNRGITMEYIKEKMKNEK